VSDNFGTAHRAHASIVGIPKFLPSYAGFLLEREIKVLETILKNPPRPLVVILGGAKTETKLPLVERFLKLGGEVLVGGVLATTILAARGWEVGRSLIDSGAIASLRRLKHPRLFLPVDVRVASQKYLHIRNTPIDDIAPEESIYDLGQNTVKIFVRVIKKAKTILWNGPMGLAEVPRFSLGTVSLARAIQRSKGLRVVGGGDTVAVLKKYKLLRGFDHVSTGGGAMLEFLSGKRLPGIEVLRK